MISHCYSIHDRFQQFVGACNYLLESYDYRLQALCFQDTCKLYLFSGDELITFDEFQDQHTAKLVAKTLTASIINAKPRRGGTHAEQL